MITASVTVSPRYSSAVFLMLARIKELISAGELSLSWSQNPNVTIGRLLDPVRQDIDVVLNLRRAEFTSDEPFDGKNRVLGVGDGLPFGDLPHQAFAAIRNPPPRKGWSRPPSGLVMTLASPPSITATHELVVSQIDSDDLTHVLSSLKYIYPEWCFSLTGCFRAVPLRRPGRPWPPPPWRA